MAMEKGEWAKNGMKKCRKGKDVNGNEKWWVRHTWLEKMVEYKWVR